MCRGLSNECVFVSYMDVDMEPITGVVFIDMEPIAGLVIGECVFIEC